MKRTAITHAFVEFIPDNLEDSTLYVSMPYATAVHKCFCGCGNEVVTPLSPTDWRLTFDGKTISLHPSIGSWSLACKSHYWIQQDKVEWAPQWSRKQIEAERERDRWTKQQYFEGSHDPADEERLEPTNVKTSRWNKIRRWWSDR
jgi:hypothetical protein